MKFVTTTLLFFAFVISFAQDQITNFKSGIFVRSGASRLVEYNGKLLFVSSDQQRGSELWISDGTAAATTLVRDINPGNGGSGIDRFLKLNDHVYFTANDGLHGLQLWITDGTATGTKSVTSAVADIQGPIISDGNRMYFLCANNSKLHLWRSDGSAAGTELIKGDIAIVNAPSNFSLIGDLLYFTVGTGNSSKVWRSDGTSGGTFAISNAIDRVGADPGGTFHPSHFLEFNGELYFIGRGGPFAFGQSGLVKATGNIGETIAIKTFHDGTIARYGDAFTHNNKMYFTFFQVAEKRFFIVESDGTTDNTTIIFDKSYPDNFSPARVLADGNYFYFTAGTAGGGTSLVKFDITNHTENVIGSVGAPYDRIPVFIAPIDVTTIFKMDDNIFIISKNGQPLGELWHLNIPSGTLSRAGDVEAGYPATIFNNNFYFTGMSSATPQRYGIWQSDGTTAGTTALTDAPAHDRGLSTTNLFSFKEQALFLNRDDEYGEELWVTDGSADGTHLLVDALPGKESSSPYPLLELNGSLIFAAYTADGQMQLHKTDGTAQGTRSFTSIEDYPVDYKAGKKDDASFFFSARNRAAVNKPNFLYISDGTADGTRVVKNLGTNIYGVGVSVTGIVTVGGRAIFSGALDGTDLWTSDGTEDGTIKIADFEAINELVVVNNTVYFTALQGSETELYRTDGTSGGTAMVKNLNSDGSAAPKSLVAFHNKLLFTAVEEGTGRELWITDGTSDGTKVLKDIAPGIDHGIFTPQIVVLGDNFYFTADDRVHGSELWKSDGSTENTNMLKDIVPGSDEGRPGKFKVVNDKIYFQAFTPEHGYEVWVSDGTAANTKLMFDLVEGPGYSNPAGFIGVNKSLVFFGLTRTNGNQLWSYKEQEQPVTGTEDLQESALAIFPNPSTGSYYIQLPNENWANVTLEVLTLDGRLVNFSFVNGEGKLTIYDSSPGLYILKIRSSGKTFIRKVVKF